MADEAFRVAALSLKGYKCSHIMVQIGLDAQEKTNPDLLRAMTGLILESVLKVREILEVNGFELDGRSGAEQG